MKKVSVILLVIGIIVTIGLVVYYKSQVNPVDSDSMAIDGNGFQTSRWPIFIGIILAFVGGLFYYVSQDEKKAE
jgi:hypothetical protein